MILRRELECSIHLCQDLELRVSRLGRVLFDKAVDVRVLGFFWRVEPRILQLDSCNILQSKSYQFQAEIAVHGGYLEQR